MKFSLGKLVITPDALSTLEEANQRPFDFVERHIKGDWGDMCEDDKQSNEEAILEGRRIMSAYKINPEQEEKVWIITEADRSSTTILLPSEY
ncbi:MAG: hypothetical protein V4525_08240 [Pseudomonadota bacterium]